MEYVGVDIGGSTIKAGLVSSKGNVVRTSDTPSGASLGRESFLDSIKSAIRDIIPDNASGIGLGCPSPLDSSREMILNPPNIPLRNTPLKRIIEKEFGVPVALENDANCFVLGEALFGKASKNRIVVGMTLGTGLGGGVVINKELFRGNGNAAEFWFSTINFDGVKGKIRNQGAVEEYLSIRGLMRLVKDLDAKNPREVFELAEKGSREAREALTQFGRYIGIFSINIISAFDPDAIVIGGKIARANKYFRRPIMEELKKAPFNNAEIQFIDDSGLSAIMGAASLVMNTKKRRRVN